ncbi:MAG: HEAT repeat domain-containing protein [Candidatus Omnitrophica bacterium]|nr:HEAT repeat domain-containing protein [Candidatus Omnitrophota bacterium]
MAVRGIAGGLTPLDKATDRLMGVLDLVVESSTQRSSHPITPISQYIAGILTLPIHGVGTNFLKVARGLYNINLEWIEGSMGYRGPPALREIWIRALALVNPVARGLTPEGEVNWIISYRFTSEDTDSFLIVDSVYVHESQPTEIKGLAAQAKDFWSRRPRTVTSIISSNRDILYEIIKKLERLGEPSDEYIRIIMMIIRRIKRNVPQDHSQAYLEDKIRHGFRHSLEDFNTVLDLFLGRGSNENINLRAILYAALLHDISNVASEEHLIVTRVRYSAGTLNNHHEDSANLAVRILEGVFGGRIIKEIIHIVLTHRNLKERAPQTEEAIIFHDADKIQAYWNIQRSIDICIGLGEPFLKPNLSKNERAVVLLEPNYEKDILTMLFKNCLLLGCDPDNFYTSYAKSKSGSKDLLVQLLEEILDFVKGVLDKKDLAAEYAWGIVGYYIELIDEQRLEKHLPLLRDSIPQRYLELIYRQPGTIKAKNERIVAYRMRFNLINFAMNCGISAGELNNALGGRNAYHVEAGELEEVISGLLAQKYDNGPYPGGLDGKTTVPSKGARKNFYKYLAKSLKSLRPDMALTEIELVRETVSGKAADVSTIPAKIAILEGLASRAPPFGRTAESFAFQVVIDDILRHEIAELETGSHQEACQRSRAYFGQHPLKLPEFLTAAEEFGIILDGNYRNFLLLNKDSSVAALRNTVSKIIDVRLLPKRLSAADFSRIDCAIIKGVATNKDGSLEIGARMWARFTKHPLEEVELIVRNGVVISVRFLGDNTVFDFPLIIDNAAGEITDSFVKLNRQGLEKLEDVTIKKFYLSRKGRLELGGRSWVKLSNYQSAEVEVEIKNGAVSRVYIVKDKKWFTLAYVWDNQSDSFVRTFSSLRAYELAALENATIKQIYLDAQGNLSLGGRQWLTLKSYPCAQAEVDIKNGIVTNVRVIDGGNTVAEVFLSLAYDNPTGKLIDSFMEITRQRFSKFSDVTIKNFRLDKSGILQVGGRVWGRFTDYPGQEVEIKVRDGVVTEIIFSDGHTEKFKLIYKGGKLVDSFFQLMAGSKLKSLDGVVIKEVYLNNSGCLSMGGRIWVEVSQYPNEKVEVEIEGGKVIRIILIDKDENIELSQVLDGEGNVKPIFHRRIFQKTLPEDGSIQIRLNIKGALALAGKSYFTLSAYPRAKIEIIIEKGIFVKARFICDKDGLPVFDNYGKQLELDLRFPVRQQINAKVPGALGAEPDVRKLVIVDYDGLLPKNELIKRLGYAIVRGIKLDKKGHLVTGRKMWALFKDYPDEKVEITVRNGIVISVKFLSTGKIIEFCLVYDTDGRLLDSFYNRITPKRLKEWGNVKVSNFVLDNKGGLTIGGKNWATFSRFPGAITELTITGGVVAAVKFIRDRDDNPILDKFKDPLEFDLGRNIPEQYAKKMPEQEKQLSAEELLMIIKREFREKLSAELCRKGVAEIVAGRVITLVLGLSNREDITKQIQLNFVRCGYFTHSNLKRLKTRFFWTEDTIFSFASKVAENAVALKENGYSLIQISWIIGKGYSAEAFFELQEKYGVGRAKMNQIIRLANHERELKAIRKKLDNKESNIAAFKTCLKAQGISDELTEKLSKLFIKGLTGKLNRGLALENFVKNGFLTARQIEVIEEAQDYSPKMFNLRFKPEVFAEKLKQALDAFYNGDEELGKFTATQAELLIYRGYNFEVVKKIVHTYNLPKTVVWDLIWTNSDPYPFFERSLTEIGRFTRETGLPEWFIRANFGRPSIINNLAEIKDKAEKLSERTGLTLYETLGLIRSYTDFEEEAAKLQAVSKEHNIPISLVYRFFVRHGLTIEDVDKAIVVLADNYQGFYLKIKRRREEIAALINAIKLGIDQVDTGRNEDLVKITAIYVEVKKLMQQIDSYRYAGIYKFFAENMGGYYSRIQQAVFAGYKSGRSQDIIDIRAGIDVLQDKIRQDFRNFQRGHLNILRKKRLIILNRINEEAKLSLRSKLFTIFKEAGFNYQWSDKEIERFLKTLIMRLFAAYSKARERIIGPEFDVAKFKEYEDSLVRWISAEVRALDKMELNPSLITNIVTKGFTAQMIIEWANEFPELWVKETERINKIKLASIFAVHDPERFILVNYGPTKRYFEQAKSDLLSSEELYKAKDYSHVNLGIEDEEKLLYIIRYCRMHPEVENGGHLVERAVHLLLNNYYWFIRMLSRKYGSYLKGGHYDDLFQEGVIVFYEAVDNYKFSYKKGLIFKKHLYYRIINFYSKYVGKEKSSFYPSGIISKINKLRKLLAEFGIDYEKFSQQDVERITQAMKVRPKTARHYLEIMNLMDVTSMDAPIGKDEGSDFTLNDKIASADPTPEEELIAREEEGFLNGNLAKILALLDDDVERLIIKNMVLEDWDVEKMRRYLKAELDIDLTEDKLLRLETMALEKMKLLLVRNDIVTQTPSGRVILNDVDCEEGRCQHPAAGKGFFGNLGADQIQDIGQAIDTGKVKKNEIFEIASGFYGETDVPVKFYCIEGAIAWAPPVFVHARLRNGILEVSFSQKAHDLFSKTFTKKELSLIYRAVAIHEYEEVINGKTHQEAQDAHRQFLKGHILLGRKLVDIMREVKDSPDNIDPFVEESNTALDWQEIFGDENRIHVEIGFGAGDNLIRQAKDNPDVNFIGIELNQEYIDYLGQTYSWQDIFEGLKIISEDIRDSRNWLTEIWEPMHLVNSWYADDTTRIKPNNLIQYRELGVDTIQSKMGVLYWFTGHNTLIKMKVPFMCQQNGYAHFEIDKGMAKKFGQQGGYAIIGPMGIRLRGFDSDEHQEVIDSPVTTIVDKKTGEITETIENPGLSREEFLEKISAALSSEQMLPECLSEDVDMRFIQNIDGIFELTEKIWLRFAYWTKYLMLIKGKNKELLGAGNKTGIYAGSGADASSFFLATDCQTGVFIQNNPFDIVSGGKLKREGYWREYLWSKVFQGNRSGDEFWGWATCDDKSKPYRPWGSLLLLELGAMGAENIRPVTDKGVLREVIFDWAYSGEKAVTRRIICITADIYDNDNYPHQLTGFLGKGIDVYFEKAQNGPYFIRNEKIADLVKGCLNPGGLVIVSVALIEEGRDPEGGFILRLPDEHAPWPSDQLEPAGFRMAKSHSSGCRIGSSAADNLIGLIENRYLIKDNCGGYGRVLGIWQKTDSAFSDLKERLTHFIDGKAMGYLHRLLRESFPASYPYVCGAVNYIAACLISEEFNIPFGTADAHRLEVETGFIRDLDPNHYHNFIVMYLGGKKVLLIDACYYAIADGDTKLLIAEYSPQTLEELGIEEFDAYLESEIKIYLSRFDTKQRDYLEERMEDIARTGRVLEADPPVFTLIADRGNVEAARRGSYIWGDDGSRIRIEKIIARVKLANAAKPDRGQDAQITIAPLLRTDKDAFQLSEFLASGIETAESLERVWRIFLSEPKGKVCGGYKALSVNPDTNKEQIEGIIFFLSYPSLAGDYLGIVGLESRPEDRGKDKKFRGIPEEPLGKVVEESLKAGFEGRVFLKCGTITDSGRNFAHKVSMTRYNGWGFHSQEAAFEYLSWLKGDGDERISKDQEKKYRRLVGRIVLAEDSNAQGLLKGLLKEEQRDGIGQTEPVSLDRIDIDPLIRELFILQGITQVPVHTKKIFSRAPIFTPLQACAELIPMVEELLGAKSRVVIRIGGRRGAGKSSFAQMLSLKLGIKGISNIVISLDDGPLTVKEIKEGVSRESQRYSVVIVDGVYSHFGKDICNLEEEIIPFVGDINIHCEAEELERLNRRSDELKDAMLITKVHRYTTDVERRTADLIVDTTSGKASLEPIEKLIELARSYTGMDIQDTYGFQRIFWQFNIEPRVFLEEISNEEGRVREEKDAEVRKLFDEIASRLNVIASQGTRLRRHPKQLEKLIEDVLPRLIIRKKANGDSSIQIVVIGSSTGEEMGTIFTEIAAAFEMNQDGWGKLSDWDITFKGIDVNRRNIAQAKRNLFNDGELEDDEARSGPGYKNHVRDYLGRYREQIDQGGVLQLMHGSIYTDEALAELDSADVIFYNNVANMLTSEAQEKVSSYLEALKDTAAIFTTSGNIHSAYQKGSFGSFRGFSLDGDGYLFVPAEFNQGIPQAKRTGAYGVLGGLGILGSQQTDFFELFGFSPPGWGIITAAAVLIVAAFFIIRHFREKSDILLKVKKEQRKTLLLNIFYEDILNIKSLLNRLIHVILPLSVSLGSFYILALSFTTKFGNFSSVAACLAATGILVSLPSFVDNIKRILERRPSSFSLGTGKGVNELTVQKRLALAKLAEQYYLRQYKKIKPSLFSAIKKIFSLRGLALMAGGGTTTFFLFSSTDWTVLSFGALFTAFVPYLFSVTYYFFCSYTERYRFRSMCIGEYLAEGGLKDKLAGELAQIKPEPEFLLPLKGSWNKFTLRFPVVAGTASLLLVKMQVVFWGSVIASAILPFLGIGFVNSSLFEEILPFCELIKWDSGITVISNTMNMLNNLGFAFTAGDIIRLAIIALGLGILSIGSQLKNTKLNFWVPFKTFAKSWVNLVHLWLIVAIIGVLTPWNLLHAAQPPGINLSQTMHYVLGGQEDVATWQKANLLYRQMQFDPASVLQMETGEDEAELLLERFKAEEVVKLTDEIRNDPNLSAFERKQIEELDSELKTAKEQLKDNYESSLQEDQDEVDKLIEKFEKKYNRFGGRYSRGLRSFYAKEYVKAYQKAYKEAFEKYKKQLSGVQKKRAEEFRKIYGGQLRELSKKEIKPEYPDKPQVRQFSIFLLGQKDTPRAKEVISRYLDDRDNDVRTMALIYSSKNSDKKPAVSLANLSFEKGGLAQYAAILNMSDSHLPGTTDFFFNNLNNARRPEIRAASLTALAGRIKEKYVKDALLWALDDPAPQVQIAAIEAVTPWVDPKKVEPLLIGDNVPVRQAAIMSISSRLGDAPGNLDLVSRYLDDIRPEIRTTTLDALGPWTAKFPELKQPFMDIARDAGQSIELRQDAMLYLSQVNVPEVKNLFVDNLDNDDWQLRQAATLGLGNFKGPEIPKLLAPKVEDPAWQVRQVAAVALGGFEQPQAIRSLEPLLRDSNLEVRRASVLPLAASLNDFPELKQPLVDRYEDRFEDEWIRSVALTSLQGVGYSAEEPYFGGIESPKKAIVVFVNGLYPLPSGRSTSENWTDNLKIKQDYERLKKLGLIIEYEFKWSGNLKDYPKALEDFKSYAINIYKKARLSNINSVTFVDFSAGNSLAYEGINNFNNLNKIDYLKADRDKIQINIINTGSPAFESSKRYSVMTDNTGGQHKNFVGFLDPIAWLSAASPNSELILGTHTLGDYFENKKVRLLTLSYITGWDIPMGYSRISSGNFSDPYIHGSFRIQQTNLKYLSGARTTITNTWTRYQDTNRQFSFPNSNMNQFNNINFRSPVFQVPKFTPPSFNYNSYNLNYNYNNYIQRYNSTPRYQPLPKISPIPKLQQPPQLYQPPPRPLTGP